MPPLPPPQPPKRRAGLFLAVGVAGVIIGALAVALVVSAGGDDDASTAASSTVPPSTVEGGVVPAENQEVVVTGAPLPALPEPGADDAALNEEAPALAGYSFDGSPIAVEPGGSPKMVVFLAHWCPHCNAEIPRLIEWKETGRVPEGLEVIAVSTAVRSDSQNYPPSSWMVARQWPWPVMADSADSEAATAYGLTGFPYFVLIGEDGTVKVRFSGEIEVDQLDSLVRAALAN